MNINKSAADAFDTLVERRRYLHMHPELSFQEHQTYQYILQHLNSFPHVDVREHVGGQGIVATITNGEGPVIALRADFDALPIQDEKDVPYKSTVPNVMHACGHDGHTSTLLSVAEILSSHYDEITGTVKLLFQFAEELAPGGAEPMTHDGALEGVDAIYGNHFWSQYDTNTIYSREGAIMASPDFFNVTIYGKGGHGAKPHTSIDSIVVMAEFINNIQTIVSRAIDPVESAVVTVGKVEAGQAFNIISNQAFCTGTVRTFKPEIQGAVEQALENELKGLSISKGITYDFEFMKGYPAVTNHTREYNIIKQAAARAGLVYEDTPPMMIGEDFSYYLLHKPGAFFLTGSGNADKNSTAPHHHPLFDLDEDALPSALLMFLSILQEEGVIHD